MRMLRIALLSVVIGFVRYLIAPGDEGHKLKLFIEVIVAIAALAILIPLGSAVYSRLESKLLHRGKKVERKAFNPLCLSVHSNSLTKKIKGAKKTRQKHAQDRTKEMASVILDRFKKCFKLDDAEIDLNEIYFYCIFQVGSVYHDAISHQIRGFKFELDMYIWNAKMYAFEVVDKLNKEELQLLWSGRDEPIDLKQFSLLQRSRYAFYNDLQKKLCDPVNLSEAFHENMKQLARYVINDDVDQLHAKSALLSLYLMPEIMRILEDFSASLFSNKALSPEEILLLDT